MIYASCLPASTSNTMYMRLKTGGCRNVVLTLNSAVSICDSSGGLPAGGSTESGLLSPL